ncbi:hypothetical protein [Thioclava sp.]|uniref:hypothetical protein n=1 Tax=Thioclava sp. TaxID=1933450 RepID=UPI003AA80108
MTGFGHDLGLFVTSRQLGFAISSSDWEGFLGGLLVLINTQMPRLPLDVLECDGHVPQKLRTTILSSEIIVDRRNHTDSGNPILIQ